MRTLLAALTALMLFATPVVAGDLEDLIPWKQQRELLAFEGSAML